MFIDCFFLCYARRYIIFIISTNCHSQIAGLGIQLLNNLLMYFLLFLYCEQRNQKKVPKKIKKARNSFLCPSGIFVCSATQNYFCLAKCYARRYTVRQQVQLPKPAQHYQPASWCNHRPKVIYPYFVLKQSSAYYCRASSEATSEAKRFGVAEKLKTAERSEDVEISCVFSSFFRTFFLLCLANKEEKKYK